MIGLVALAMLVGVAELGHGLLIEREAKRVADLAAYAAAGAYGSTGSTATMISVARNVAALNGLPAIAVTASLVASPRSPSGQAVLVKTSTRKVLLAASILGVDASLPISAEGHADVAAGALVASRKAEPLAFSAGIRSAVVAAAGASR